MSNKETASPKDAERKCSCDGRVSKLESIVYAMQRMLGKIDPEDVRKSEQDEALAVSRKGGWVHTGLLVSLCAVMMAFTAFAGADKAVFVGVEGEDVSIVLDADQGDDAADTWRITSQAADNDLSFSNAGTEVFNVTSTGAVTASLKATVDEPDASRVLTSADYGKTIFVNRAGACAITLPANAATAGSWIDVIVDGTDSTIPTISAATVDTLITFNDVAADSVTFGSGHRIGAYVRFISNGTKWVAINMGNHTMTIATD